MYLRGTSKDWSLMPNMSFTPTHKAGETAKREVKPLLHMGDIWTLITVKVMAFRPARANTRAVGSDERRQAPELPDQWSRR